MVGAGRKPSFLALITGQREEAACSRAQGAGWAGGQERRARKGPAARGGPLAKACSAGWAKAGWGARVGPKSVALSTALLHGGEQRTEPPLGGKTEVGVHALSRALCPNGNNPLRKESMGIL